MTERIGRSAGAQPGGEQRLAMAEAQLIRYALDLRTVYQAEKARREDLERAYRATLVSLSRALDLRDTDTEEHSERVTFYAVTVAEALALRPEDIEALHWGAMLHDLGKIGIPDAILRKPGPLSPQEWDVMRRHPPLGYEILRDVGFLSDSLPVVLHHHEKWDGSGYPHGLAGQAIPLSARIFAVADAFDAITSGRPYRRAETPETARQRLWSDAGTHFDPEVLQAFQAVFDRLAPQARRAANRPGARPAPA